MQSARERRSEQNKPPLSTGKLLAQVIAANEDFEWYPTTTEIINTIKEDLTANDFDVHHQPSVLDCGAGDGRVLNALTTGKRYAIEKSRPLIQALDKSIYIVGTEFEQQTLIDKKVDVVFSNPPYSEFEAWTIKIVREANASAIYLVIPTRWKASTEISAAIKLRKGRASVLGSFDFLSADRAARARIEIVKINLSGSENFRRRHHDVDVDPFDVWFNEHFKLNAACSKTTDYEYKERLRESVSARTGKELVPEGANIVSVLYQLYQSDLENLINTYRAVCSIDGGILRELDVNISGIKAALSQKIKGLKDCYWQELFNNLSRVTDRLTSQSRRHMLETLAAHTHVDFTESNVHALLIWVIKNANAYYDSQLIDIVDRMTEAANVVNYKSNQRTFGAEQWKYCRRPENLTRYAIDYRVVLTRVGGLATSSYWQNVNGLSQGAADFIGDLRAVAGNLGFDLTGTTAPSALNWSDSGAKCFVFKDHKTGTFQSLFEVRAFKNGNLHFRLNQDLICRLNCEFGRLKGWLKSAAEAMQELGVSEEAAAEAFQSNLQLDGPQLLKLCWGGH